MGCIALIILLALSFGVLAGVSAIVCWAIPFLGIPWDPTFWQVFVALFVLSLIAGLLQRTSSGS